MGVSGPELGIDRRVHSWRMEMGTELAGDEI